MKLFPQEAPSSDLTIPKTLQSHQTVNHGCKCAHWGVMIVYLCLENAKAPLTQVQTKSFSNDLVQHRPNKFYGMFAFPPFSSVLCHAYLSKCCFKIKLIAIWEQGLLMYWCLLLNHHHTILLELVWGFHKFFLLLPRVSKKLLVNPRLLAWALCLGQPYQSAAERGGPTSALEMAYTGSGITVF